MGGSTHAALWCWALRANRQLRRLWGTGLVSWALGCSSGQQIAKLGDCRLESGAVIRDCQIGYRTFGQLNADRSNAVLVTPWSMGTSGAVGRQIGPGKLVDSSRYFVIAVDALGNGVSSSPSNSRQQPDRTFPTFSMRDIVETQRRLVSEVLGIKRLRAVVGVSLGGMQAFQWAAAHPEMLDKAVSIAGTPRSSSAEQARWRAWTAALRARSPWRRAMDVLTSGAPVGAVRQLGLDGEDYARQADAIIGHDVSAAFGGSLERAAAAGAPLRMLVVVSGRDEVVDPAAAVEFARLAGAELLQLDGRCGHAAPSCEKATLWPKIAAFLER